MLPETAILSGPFKRALSLVPDAWRLPLLRVALAWLGLILLLAHDWADMADQWWNSSTYNHIVLVPFIVIWVVWQRAGELARLVPMAWWPGLLVVAGAMFVWLLGAVSGLNLARHLGAVVVLQGVVLTLLGPRVSAGLIFPLAYMFFLVPIGDEAVPALQMITAKITIALTHWSGIPAEIDGVFIDTPVGLFEVAEECSGVKFLIAMIALATLVAQTSFKSWRRRIAFMAVAVILPILANGVRAWGTIFIAQSQGIEFAVGFDHIFYGWVFFAIVMALLLALAWRYFDRPVEDPQISVHAIEHSALLRWAERFRSGGWGMFSAVAALALLANAWAVRASMLDAPVPAEIRLPEVPGWHLVDYSPVVWWEPRARGADHRLLGRYRDADGHAVDVFFAMYSAQREGHEAGSFGEGALMPDSAWRWLRPGPAVGPAASEYLLAEGRVQRFAATYYRTGGLLTGSNGQLKLANMRDRLLMRERPTMVLILSAERQGEHSEAESVEAFVKATGSTARWIDGIAQLP